MATFIIKCDGESTTIEAASLSAAKVKATKIQKENNGVLIFVCDQNGNELSVKAYDWMGRGFWVDRPETVKQEDVKQEAVEAPKKAKRRACVPVQFIESKGNEVVELGSLNQGEPVKPSVNDVFMKVGDEYVNAGTGEKVPASSVDKSAKLRDHQIKTLSNAIVNTGTSKGFVGRAVIVEPQQKPKLVSKYDTEIHDNREFVELFGASFEVYGHIIPPVHARIQHGSAINSIHVLATKTAFNDLRSMWYAGIKPNQFCFVECDCGTVVYVTIDEATRLGQPVIRSLKQDESFAIQGEMNTRLYYAGCTAEALYPILKSENGAEVELSRVMTAKVFAENGDLVVSSCSDVVAMPDHYMVSDDAGQAMSDYFNKGWFMPFEIGFVQTSCGMAAIVTDEEAEKLGEKFLKVKLQD